jgi:hypothetical protein
MELTTGSQQDDGRHGLILHFVTEEMDRQYFRQDDETSRNIVADALNQAYSEMKQRSDGRSNEWNTGALSSIVQNLLFKDTDEKKQSLLISTTTTRTADALATQFYNLLENSQHPIRVRDTEFGIVGTQLIWGEYEMESLHDHVNDLYRWYEEENVRQNYAAPYKPVIQSSGTGKTKILREFCRRLTATETIHCVFISCLPRDAVRALKPNTYDLYLDTNSNLLDSLTALLTNIGKKDSPPSKILLVFDEAQQLSKGQSAGLLTLRKFLRRKRENVCVVALLAGTTTCLANCYPPEAQRASSREGETHDTYYQSGNCLYGPIWELYTMGCYADKISFQQTATDFERAIPYGRPLFARLLFAETDPANTTYPVLATLKLTDPELARIATRMLLGATRPFDSEGRLVPFVSIWATRIQLGCTQASVVDELVAKGYAHLTNFSAPNDKFDGGLPQPTASFSYLADPVCAYLAMQFMNEEWKLDTDDRSLAGYPKQRWVAKLKEVFSCGVCRPPRGDLGEVLCAAYLLFCGDAIRFQLDVTGQSFSIPVDYWVAKAEKPDSNDEPTGMPSNIECPRINFLQFCRNDLRFGLLDCCNQNFLEHIYKRCCAVYAYNCCPLYDAVAAVESKTAKGGKSYSPVLMSIKTVANFTEQSGLKAIDSIVKALCKKQVTSALILVVVLDHGIDHNEEEEEESEAVIDIPPSLLLSWQQVSNLSRQRAVRECGTAIVARIISIPNNDPFGITDLARSLTGSDDDQAVYPSQTFIGSMPSANLRGGRPKQTAPKKAKTNGELETSRVLTIASDDRTKQKLHDIWNERM